jgi:hypothetical protein
MSLIHALVARGTTVLAEHATGTAELKPGGYLQLDLARSRGGRAVHHWTVTDTSLSCADHYPVQDPSEQLETDL